MLTNSAHCTMLTAHFSIHTSNYTLHTAHYTHITVRRDTQGGALWRGTKPPPLRQRRGEVSSISTVYYTIYNIER